ncbi:unnamed protein product [Discosporangium mesarthrocarpum]
MPPKVLVPHLGSLTGGLTTPDLLGKRLKGVMYDISHLGVTTQDNLNFVDLPESFTELYSRVKSPRVATTGGQESDTAVCLICGKVVAAGHKPPIVGTNAGECTLHARDCGSGTGRGSPHGASLAVYNCCFLPYFKVLQPPTLHLIVTCTYPFGMRGLRCVVLLIRGRRAAFYQSIYLDDHGEEDKDLNRGRPLFLNRHCYHALKMMYVQHKVSQEVSAIRASAHKVIRENYY